MAKEKDTKPMANTVIGSSIVIDGEITAEESLTHSGNGQGQDLSGAEP